MLLVTKLFRFVGNTCCKTNFQVCLHLTTMNLTGKVKLVFISPVCNPSQPTYGETGHMRSLITRIHYQEQLRLMFCRKFP